MRFATFFARPHRFVAPLCLLAGVLLPWTAAGCGSSAGSLCNSRCDCEQNCSDAARESCIKTSEDNFKIAVDVGCGDQADAALSCSDERSQCIATKWTTGGCDTENTKLVQCLGSARCIFIGTALHCG